MSRDIEHYGKKLIEFNSISGEYIQACNQLELVATQYIMKHFVNDKDLDTQHEFVSYFISTKNISQQTLITILNKILTKHHKDFYNEKIEYVKKDVINNYVQLRNVLAHSLFSDVNYETKYDEGEYALNWISNLSGNDFIRKELDIINKTDFLFLLKKDFLVKMNTDLHNTILVLANYFQEY